MSKPVEIRRCCIVLRSYVANMNSKSVFCIPMHVLLSWRVHMHVVSRKIRMKPQPTNKLVIMQFLVICCRNNQCDILVQSKSLLKRRDCWFRNFKKFGGFSRRHVQLKNVEKKSEQPINAEGVRTNELNNFVVQRTIRKTPEHV